MTGGLDLDELGIGHPCDTFTVATWQHTERGHEALQCDNCGATWVGRRYEDCAWCARRIERSR